jgi:ParB family chromosome partitioning protein
MQTVHAARPLDFSALQDGDTGTISPALIDDFRFGNQRGKRSKKSFAELVSAVKQHGVFTPLTLWRSENGDTRLEAIAGHGRRDAALEAGVDAVPFVFRDVTPEEAFEMHLKENNVREDISFVAHSAAVVRYMTEFKGDVEAVASRMNISAKKCRELLEINKCSAKVKKAIGEGQITLSHAILLAPFPKASQDKNLPTIIAEKWTVATLRQRVGKAKLPLERAAFDTTECAACEFNTKHQMGLFENADDKSHCAKSTCFQAKTTAHMETRKAELTEQYGHILLLSQTSEKDRHTVTADVVGEAQFETCSACDDRVAVLSDAWGKAGEITENQCVNNDCFTTCKTAFAKEVKAQEVKAVAAAPDATPEQTAATAKAAAKKTTKAAASGTLSNMVIEHYKTLLRGAAKEFFKDDNNFLGSLLTAAIVSHAGLKNDQTGNARFSDLVPVMMGLTNEQRHALVKDAAVRLLTETTTDSDNGNTTDMLIRCLSVEKEKAVPFVTAYWTPSDANLKIYTKDLLVGLSKAAGVVTALDSAEQGSFTKLSNKPKAAFIKGIQGANVDWQQYAPKSLITRIAK